MKLSTTDRGYQSGKWRVEIRNSEKGYLAYFFDTSVKKTEFINGRFVATMFLKSLMEIEPPLKERPYLTINYDNTADTIYKEDLVSFSNYFEHWKQKVDLDQENEKQQEYDENEMER